MPRNLRLLIYLLFLLSGGAGLIYEVVWVRELVFVLGGTTYAITTVLVAFMSGLALGSFLAGKISDRLRQPGRIYGLLEICIGLYGLVVPLLLGLAEPLYRYLYPQVADMPWVLTGVRFLVGSIVLLVPTTCMGATLPILVGYVSGAGQAFGKSVGFLYGINTFGAMLGTLAAGFWLIPMFGLTHTTWVAAGSNLAIGIIAVIVLRSSGLEKETVKPAKQRKIKITDLLEEVTPGLRLAVLLGFSLSGFAAMVYQISWTRALIMSVGSSTYAFTCILSAFILGLAVGSLAIARWVDSWRRPVLMFGILEMAIALSAILIVPIHGRIPVVVSKIVSQYSQNYSTLLTYQFVLIISVTFVPTFLMGAIFPLVSRIVAIKDGQGGAAVGRAYAVNTVGTILGSFLAGFFMIRSEVLGIQNSIVAAALVNALVGAWLVIQSRVSGTPILVRLVCSVVVVLAVPSVSQFVGRWDRLLLNSAPYLEGERSEEEEILYFGEGVDMTVAVVRTGGEEGPISLTINGKTDASVDLADMPTQLLLGHLPALLTGDGKSACIIGLGSGMTLSAVACYPSYEHLDCVEISDEVIKAVEYFAPYNYQVLSEDSRVNLIRADGRNHLLLTDRAYDIIISEPSNPWISGVANLFTREFFTLCKDRLTDKGRLCVWLHAYSMSLDDFKMVVRTLHEVFGFVSIWQSCLHDYLLIAGAEPFAVPLEDVVNRYKEPSVWADLYRIGFGEPGQVIGRFITSGKPLREWSDSAPVHTDDNAMLEFSAPKNLYLDENVIIAGELMDRHRSVFEEVLVGEKGSKIYEDVQAKVDTVMQARRIVISSMRQYKQEDYYQALRLLVDGYQRYPDALFLYQFLVELRWLIEKNEHKLAASEAMRSLLAQAKVLRPPIISSAVGTELSDIAKVLQRNAFLAMSNNQFEQVIRYCEKLHALAPSEGQVVMWWAAAYIETNRVGQAISLLDDFLKQYPNDGYASCARGIAAVIEDDIETALPRLEVALRSWMTPSVLRQNRHLKPILDNPRFQALLDRYTQTQPATGPS
ncbi:MAG: fused MFS/spermidine synthase [Planctomycetota bacterium]|nr:MAG: fused MFS/spermidine synthase [Planctomycetota bacterium]